MAKHPWTLLIPRSTKGSAPRPWLDALRDQVEHVLVVTPTDDLLPLATAVLVEPDGPWEELLDRVLETRQNNYLPVVFLATPATSSARLQAALTARYREHLGSYFPAALVEPVVVDPTNTGAVVAAVEKMRADVGAFRAANRRRTGAVLAVGAAMTAFFFAWLVSTLRTTTTSSPPDRTAIATWTAEETTVKLQAFDQLLAAQPHAANLPTIDEARAFNAGLGWLPVKLDLVVTDPMSSPFPAELRDRMAATWDRAARLLAEKSQAIAGEPPEPRVSVLAAYLDRLHDPTGLSLPLIEAQRAYWQLERRRAVEWLGTHLAGLRETAAPPADALADTIRYLAQLEAATRRSTIESPAAQAAWLAELDTAREFCERLRTTSGYAARLRVAKVTIPGVEAEGVGRWRLSLMQPGREPFLLSLRSTESSVATGRLEAPESWHDVEFALGEGAVLSLAKPATEPDAWTTLHTFAVNITGECAVLGVPLAHDGETFHNLDWNEAGYALRIELEGLPVPPPLLREALAATAPADGGASSSER